MVGILVGQYRITGTIGVGGMGAVFSAEHVVLGRPAAVKVLLPELSNNAEMAQRFFIEAQAAATIRHPGIVEIYDFGRHSDGSAYIVMEHLQGESLAARLARGRMPTDSVLTIARQIASALAAAHGKGIVHRDLKPDNIFLVRDAEVAGGERVKLLDFGIAKVSRGDESLKTRPGVVMGTPTYMAPEQCRGIAVDHRADLYALGCILFELCTQQPPFAGAGDGDVLAAHIHTPPPIVSSLVSDLPAGLAAIIDRLLIKERDARVQSADAVVQAMEAATTSVHPSGPLAQASSPRPHAPPAGERAPRYRSVLRHLAGFVAAVAAVGAGAVAMAVGTHTRAGAPMATAPQAPAAAALVATAREALSTASPPTTSSPAPSASDRDTRATGVPKTTRAATAHTTQVQRGRTDTIAGTRAVQSAEPGPEPAANTATLPPLPNNVDEIAELYVAVGRQLTTLQQVRGSTATSDLWAQYLVMRINDALLDPTQHDATRERLRQLHDQIEERSR